VIYCRVSSKEQVEGTSLESQEIACEEYARNHGIKILRVFVERGESAKVADRTQLIELIDFCRTAKEMVHALLVWKLDRFARNVGDHFNIKATLMKYGVRVISVTEPIDTNPEGKLMETILAGFAQFDNDIRAARTVQGMRRKIQEGIFPWKPPFGYKVAARDGTKKTIPDESDQPVFGLLQRVWKEFATGAYTKTDILRLMASWSIRTARGLSMTAQSLDNFFRNPYYAGIVVDPWSREEYEGKHVPMVTREVFDRVQSIVVRRARSVRHYRERAEFPLRGVARCTQCGHNLTGGFSTGRTRRYAYYSCGNRSCPNQPNYRTDSVHEEFGALLDRIAPKPELIKTLENRILEATEEGQAARRNRRDRRAAEMKRIDQQIQELIRMRAQELITDEEFVPLKSKLIERRGALVAQPERFDARLVQANLGAITQPLSELRATWRSVPVGFRWRFNHMVVPVGFVVGNSRTAEMGLFFRALEASDERNSQEVALKGENLNLVHQAIQAFADLFHSLEEEKRRLRKRFNRSPEDSPQYEKLNHNGAE
jgi:DNA invertase Pin-like site-specific DNA recombinase